jgi:hypothetical protein
LWTLRRVWLMSGVERFLRFAVQSSEERISRNERAVCHEGAPEAWMRKAVEGSGAVGVRM